MPGGLRVASEVEPGFVHQRSRLQCMAPSFACHLLRGESPQFMIYHRHQTIRRLGVTLPGRLENLRHTGHIPKL